MTPKNPEPGERNPGSQAEKRQPEPKPRPNSADGTIGADLTGPTGLSGGSNYRQLLLPAP